MDSESIKRINKKIQEVSSNPNADSNTSTFEEEKEQAGSYEAIDFYPEYHSPTPGSFPLIANSLEHKGIFNGPGGINEKKDFIPYVPDEPEDPSDLDDRQHILNAAAAGCNLGSHRCIDNVTEMQDFMYNKLGLVVGGRNHSLYEDGDFDGFIDQFIQNKEWKDKQARVFSLADEPSIKKLWENTDTTTTNDDGKEKSRRPLLYCYTRLAKKIRDTEDLEGQILINLLPIHGLETATNYQNYLDVFQEYYHPSLYSVDVYPIMQWNPLVVRADKFSGFKEMKAGELLQVHERFYRTLEMISEQSRKHNRPFWYFLISGELFNIKSSYYPAQKEEYMRYSAFTALAYGAEALIYWRFLENVDDRNNLLLTPGEIKGNEMKYMNESFMRHPLNADRTRSPIWYYVRRINREIKRYEPIFLNTKVQNVYHTGLEELAQYAMSRYSGESEYIKHGPAPWLEDLVEPEKPTAEVWGLKPLETTSVPCIHSIESLDKGLGVIISHRSCMSGFKSAESGQNQGQNGVVAMPLPGEEYYMIVNHDSINAQKIKINFKSGYIIEELTPLKSGEDNENSPINTSDKNGCALSIERLLAPGGYLIFKRVS